MSESAGEWSSSLSSCHIDNNTAAAESTLQNKKLGTSEHVVHIVRNGHSISKEFSVMIQGLALHFIQYKDKSFLDHHRLLADSINFYFASF